jgi:hypothetical protein
MQRNERKDPSQEEILPIVLLMGKMKGAPHRKYLLKVRLAQPHCRRQRGTDRLLNNIRLHLEPTYLIT